MGESGSATYYEFIAQQLAAEEARKESIEKRGIGVITTSGAIASLLLGFAALVTEKDGFSLSSTEAALVIASTLAFALATRMPSSGPPQRWWASWRERN